MDWLQVSHHSLQKLLEAVRPTHRGSPTLAEEGTDTVPEGSATRRKGKWPCALSSFQIDLDTWEIRGRELRCTSRGRAGGDDCWDIDQKFSNHDAFDSHIYCWKRRLLQLVGGGWCCCYCCWRWCYGCYYLRSPSLISSFLLFWFCLLKRRLLLAAQRFF